MPVAKSKTTLQSGESISKVLAVTTLNNLYEASAEEIGQMVASDAELYGNAWGVVINPNSGSTALETVGNYALWSEYKEQIGRYLVSPSGKAAKLNPQNSAQYVDGTPADFTKGNVMTIFPELHFRVVTDQATGKVTVWGSTNNIGGHVIHEKKVGAYFGYVSDGKLWSRPGVTATRSKTISVFHANAQAVGKEWGITDYQCKQLLALLYLFEFHNLNSQASLGNGLTGTGDNWSHCSEVATGATAALGDYCGSIPYTENGSIGGACHISLFGVENPWGHYWEMIQGVFFGNSANAEQTGNEMFIYQGNRMPTSDELATKPHGDFRQLVRPTSSGYVSKMILGDRFDIFPSALSGSSTTYWCDYHYATNTGQLLLWGGHAGDGAICGFGCSSSVSAFGYSYSSIAARLAYYGDITHVEPSDLA